MPGQDIHAEQQSLIDEFQFFDSWMDRYQYIIELGRKLPPLPDELRTDNNLLAGCQSRVWLHNTLDNDRVNILAASDSAIVSGLIAILLRVYNGRTAAEILATPPEFVAALGLEEHLSPTRSNGLRAMLAAIMGIARQAGASDE